MTTLVLGASLTLLFASCSKSDDDAKSGDKASKAASGSKGAAADMQPDQAKKADSPSPMDGWDLNAIAAKFQGAWVFDGNAVGTKEAWEIKGDKLTRFYKGEETIWDFTVLSPCLHEASRKDGRNLKVISTLFMWSGDDLYQGLGLAGAISPDGSPIACDSQAIYTHRDGACTQWRRNRATNEWVPGDFDCTLEEGKGLTVRGRLIEFFEGGLANKQLQGNKAQKVADYSAAKAALLK